MQDPKEAEKIKETNKMGEKERKKVHALATILASALASKDLSKIREIICPEPGVFNYHLWTAEATVPCRGKGRMRLIANRGALLDFNFFKQLIGEKLMTFDDIYMNELYSATIDMGKKHNLELQMEMLDFIPLEVFQRFLIVHDEEYYDTYLSTILRSSLTEEEMIPPVMKLLDKGLDPRVPYWRGSLMIPAIEYGLGPVVNRFITQYGMSINATHPKDKTPSLCSMMRSWSESKFPSRIQGMREVIGLAVKHGYDMSQKDVVGFTVNDYILRFGFVQMFEEAGYHLPSREMTKITTIPPKHHPDSMNKDYFRTEEYWTYKFMIPNQTLLKIKKWQSKFMDEKLVKEEVAMKYTGVITGKHGRYTTSWDIRLSRMAAIEILAMIEQKIYPHRFCRDEAEIQHIIAELDLFLDKYTISRDHLVKIYHLTDMIFGFANRANFRHK